MLLDSSKNLEVKDLTLQKVKKLTIFQFICIHYTGWGFKFVTCTANISIKLYILKKPLFVENSAPETKSFKGKIKGK